MTPIETQLFVNNEFVPASTGETFDLFSSHIGELVAKVLLSPIQRGKPLKAIASKILFSTPELTELDAISMGRPISSFFDSRPRRREFQLLRRSSLRARTHQLKHPGFLNMSLRQPFGVVGIIIPWNAPLVFFSKKVAPVVAAGNWVVLKSSGKAPLTWIKECGFPPGVINVLSGHGHISGAAISPHMSIRALSFTGSTCTRRAIQIASANSNLKKAAKDTENSIFRNSGQTCMANSRICVQDTAAEKFVEVFKKLASERKMDDPTKGEINHGPQTYKTQFEAVNKYISIGQESGGSLALGDSQETSTKALKGDSKSLLIHPTIFLNAPETSCIMEFCADLRAGDLPFGGWKGSGTGRESLLESMEYSRR
ncbi:ALDH-like protein [Acephala macrosclerotiorum]|nr:ALDH-like protein [Acephala macrosclerotiorum]